MSIETIKGQLIELTYNTDSFRAVRAEIELGDSVFAKFDETATFLTYQYLRHWATRDNSEEPTKAFSFKQGKAKKPSLLERLKLVNPKSCEDKQELVIPPHLFDLAPAYVFIPRSRVKELFADFENILGQVQSSIVWPEDIEVQ